MNRTLSRTILGLLVLVAGSIVSGGAAPPPGTSRSAAASTQAADLPTECILERNHGACVSCCKEAIGAPDRACAHFCNLLKFPVPPPPEEPQP